ncbi:hypothetical protein AMTRI_Chr10g230550 [Amborella trichopoda]
MPLGRVFRYLRNFILNFGSSHDALTTTRLNGWSVVVSAKPQTERERRWYIISTFFFTFLVLFSPCITNPYYPFSLSARSSPTSCPEPHFQIS